MSASDTRLTSVYRRDSQKRTLLKIFSTAACISVSVSVSGELFTLVLACRVCRCERRLDWCEFWCEALAEGKRLGGIAARRNSTASMSLRRSSVPTAEYRVSSSSSVSMKRLHTKGSGTNCR